jgi:hypothetical protein
MRANADIPHATSPILAESANQSLLSYRADGETLDLTRQDTGTPAPSVLSQLYSHSSLILVVHLRETLTQLMQREEETIQDHVSTAGSSHDSVTDSDESASFSFAGSIMPPVSRSLRCAPR